MPIFKKKTFYLGLLGLAAAFFLLQQQRKIESVPPAAPLVPPPESPYPSSVAGAGLIEAVNENVTIAPSSSSMIEKVLVKVGEEVSPFLLLQEEKTATDCQQQLRP
jgi:multidrug efflux pump subunit AcrA (membrane-fusion protein)